MAQEFPDSPRRRDAGILQITNRDVLALNWMSEQLCISFDHLQALLGRYAKAETKMPNLLSVSATRNALNRWLAMDLIDPPRKILAGYPPHIWLSRHGLAQLHLPFAYYQPKPGSIAHLYAVNRVRLHLETYGLRTQWHARRLLLRASQERPLPDAELRARATPVIAIQVLDRPLVFTITQKEEAATLRTLAERYASIWYFAHPDALPTLQDALTTLDQPTQERITLYGLDAEPLAEPTPATHTPDLSP